MNYVRRVFCIGALSLLLGGTPAQAQLSTGQFSGRIADQSGAVLPGVTVTATQTDTGFTRTVVTDSDGSYVMPNLPTGPYRLEVSLQGFRTVCPDRHRAAGGGHAAAQCGARGWRAG